MQQTGFGSSGNFGVQNIYTKDQQALFMRAFESSIKGHKGKGSYARSHVAFGSWDHLSLFATLEEN